MLVCNLNMSSTLNLELNVVRNTVEADNLMALHNHRRLYKTTTPVDECNKYIKHF